MSAANVHPKLLAELIDNAVEFSTYKGPSDFNDTIYLRPEDGALTAYGFHLYALLRESREVEGMEPGDGLMVDRYEVADFAKALRKVDGFGRKDTAVQVELGSRFTVTHGDQTLVDLGESPSAENLGSTAEHVGLYELADEWLGREDREVRGVRLTKDMAQKLTKIKTGKPPSDVEVWEMRAVGDKGAMRVRIGQADVYFMSARGIIEMD
ncbi:hypothetical protein Q7C18_02905 [Nesterenkonia sp. CL21]|uniref:hypothetical protein n=1 Tax=Nesterenkonia sp. CL21 TaxID=3064894 RepID=UPI002879B298|nr:hypothetical protein [Nesterenkonia sp. CL21]MDS2171637.1 hypothetical protein [Nesterenkonia sp. CL21]